MGVYLQLAVENRRELLGMNIEFTAVRERGTEGTYSVS